LTRVPAKIDAVAQVRRGKLANTIERRIQKIENQEQRP
jgi:RNA processing factor Prp31